MMWSDAADHAEPAYLDRLAAPAWGWEFLRRNPEYRRQALQSARPVDDSPQHGGPHTLERKEVEVPARRWGLLAFRKC